MEELWISIMLMVNKLGYWLKTHNRAGWHRPCKTPLASTSNKQLNRPRSVFGNMSDCRSRGREFDPGSVLYFCGD